MATIILRILDELKRMGLFSDVNWSEGVGEAPNERVKSSFDVKNEGYKKTQRG